jgi:hypothetical protein
MKLKTENSVRKAVIEAVARTPVLDMHTHIYDQTFGKLLLWGIDELLTYHYLVAEFFRARPDYSTAAFWKLSKKKQADLIWQALFVERTPVSESCRGILTCLQAIGISPGPDCLTKARAFFKKQKAAKYIDKVFKLSGVSHVVMTNNPFDDLERPVWDQAHRKTDKRFIASLRIDDLLVDWPGASEKLRKMGYPVTGSKNGPDANGARVVRNFLADWTAKINPVYLAASMPTDFKYPLNNACNKVLDKCILPFASEAGLPMALMLGCRRQVNPELGLAGDAVGPSDVPSVEALCRQWSDIRFLITLLARENQHQLCIAARKFGNLMPFGCWWFLNDPSIIDMMTRQRLELLGLSVIPQHSDARVLDQLIYKWAHSRQIIGEVLADKFADSFNAGWPLTTEEIVRDVERLFSGNFLEFIGRSL